MSDRYKISHYHYHYYYHHHHHHHHHQSPDNGSELLGSEEESEESDTVLHKEGNSENDVIADLEEQSIMTGHTGASTVSTTNACTLYYQTITFNQNQ